MQGKHWTYGENGRLKMENGKSGVMRLTQRTLRTQRTQRAERKGESGRLKMARLREKASLRRIDGEAWRMM